MSSYRLGSHLGGDVRADQSRRHDGTGVDERVMGFAGKQPLSTVAAESLDQSAKTRDPRPSFPRLTILVQHEGVEALPGGLVANVLVDHGIPHLRGRRKDKSNSSCQPTRALSLPTRQEQPRVAPARWQCCRVVA